MHDSNGSGGSSISIAKIPELLSVCRRTIGESCGRSQTGGSCKEFRFGLSINSNIHHIRILAAAAVAFYYLYCAGTGSVPGYFYGISASAEYNLPPAYCPGISIT